MTDLVHTEDCAAQQQAQKNWDARWPKACKSCDARGGHVLWATHYEPEDFNFCSCVNNGCCPRCGGTNIDPEGEEPCNDCGWDWGHGEDDYRPEWECMCFYTDLSNDEEDWMRGDDIDLGSYDFAKDDEMYDAWRDRRGR